MRRLCLAGAAIELGALAPGDAQTLRAAAPLRIYAAGSLRGAFDAMVKASGAGDARMIYGGSGLLRTRLERAKPPTCLHPPILTSHAA